MIIINPDTIVENEKVDRELLYKYLFQLYKDKKIIKGLLKDYKDKLFDGIDSLAYKLGKKSLPFFCQYFLQDTFRIKSDNAARKLAPYHFEIWETLESMFIDNDFDKLELIMPRGASKSTTVNFALSIWTHCYKFSKYTLVAGNTEQDAIEFVAEVRRSLEESSYIHRVFGKLVDSRVNTVNRLELELTNGTKIQAISSTSSPRGKKYDSSRPTIIIADDYQKKEDVITPEAREKKFKSWQEDSYYAGDKPVIRDGKVIKPGTKYIVLGTPLHSDDFISRLLADKTYKHIVKRAILIDDIDEMFNSGLWKEFKSIHFDSKRENPVEDAKEFYLQHKKYMSYPVLWQDKYDCHELALDYFSDPIAFKQEMQCDASKIGEKPFKKEQVVRLPSIELEDKEKFKYIKSILCVDPAGGGKESKHDYSAFAVGSLTKNNFKVIRKGIIDKCGFDAMINKIVELLFDYEDITHIWIEKNFYRGADVLELQKRIDEIPELKKRKIKILNESQHKNKQAKIQAIAGKVNSGLIIFNEDDEEAVNQLIDYDTLARHDDFPDIVAECVRLLDEIKTSSGVVFTSFNELLNGR